MKILYKDKIDKILSNTIVCNYCGCEFLITDKEKEVSKSEIVRNVLKDNTGKSKYLVIDYYATFCPNCNRRIHITDSDTRIVDDID